jgi:hypothetical protein
MTALILIGTLIVISVLAPHYGTDSRSRQPSGWLATWHRG